MAAALTVTPCTIARTMATRRTIRGTIIGPMRMRPTIQCIGFIDQFTVTQGISRGTEFTGLMRFIGRLRMQQHTGHSIGPLRMRHTGRFIDRLRMQRIGHFIGGALRTGVSAKNASQTRSS